MKKIIWIFKLSVLCIITLCVSNAVFEYQFLRDRDNGVLKRQITLKLMLKYASQKKKAALNRGYLYDDRSERQFLLQTKKNDDTIIKSQCPGDYRSNSFRKKDYIALGGKSLATTLAGNHYGYYYTYKSDRYGFRNLDFKWDVAATRKGVDAFILGGGTAQGYFVEQKNTITGIFKSKNLNALSLGCNSNGPLVSLASLREYGKGLRSRVIIYLFEDVNDLDQLVAEKRHHVLSKYLRDQSFTQNLKKKQVIIDKDIQQSYNLWFRNTENKKIKQISLDSKDSTIRRLITGRHIRQKLKKIWINTSRASQPNKMPEWRDSLSILGEILKEMQKVSHQMGSKFLFVYLPDSKILHKLVVRNKEKRASSIGYNFKSRIVQMVKNNNIDILDVEPELKLILPVDKLYPLGGYTELGVLPNYFGVRAHRIIAESIHKKLSQMGVFPTDRQ